MTKNNIRYFFHWCQYKKRPRQIMPKIIDHRYIQILTLWDA
ncbi:hypothetical protein NBRC111894_2372 [Sporolactobacillus inulinus]|uniref:Uncharacterized protein n=1 Tax=Sporolactobacillus inulinus TaxID=2078 RepID=A0A4Y1ZE04_9BACL|nr:hypothetical protein NBRC111894_2372 [Sporolactobacillus inulinus]